MSDFNTPAPPPPPGYGLGAGVPANHPRAVLILVLGILSITCCGIFTGIPAFIMGKKALAEIDASGGTIGGRGMVQAGWICSIVGMVLFVLGVIFQIAVRSGS
jgi:hypothetical protein